MTTPAQQSELQALLDRSFARSTSHLTMIMSEPRRLTAERLVAELPCPAVLNIASVTARGEPRVSAVDGHFLGGRWCFATSPQSAKARQLRARPVISASYTPRDGEGVFCHGRVVELTGTALRELDDHWQLDYGHRLDHYGPEIYAAAIEAEWLVGFAMTPDEEKEMARASARRAARKGR